MSEKLTRLSCEDYVNVLASKEPVPGGGGTAALVGALGVALGNMVGSLTVGKQKYAGAEPEILRLKEKSDALQVRLLDMVDRDAEAFAPLAAAYGLPAGEEKTRIMEEALAVAAAAPLRIMALCCEAVELVERFAAIGNRMAVSDAGCAAACLWSALSAANLNVCINTRLMKDRQRAEGLNRTADYYLSHGTGRAKAVYESVQELLR